MGGVQLRALGAIARSTDDNAAGSDRVTAEPISFDNDPRNEGLIVAWNGRKRIPANDWDMAAHSVSATPVGDLGQR